jgi:hypothetical protein
VVTLLAHHPKLHSVATTRSLKMLKMNRETPKSSPYSSPKAQRQIKNDYHSIAESVLQLLKDDFIYVNQDLKRFFFLFYCIVDLPFRNTGGKISHAWKTSQKKEQFLAHLSDLCKGVTAVLSEEPMLLELSSPTYVLGILIFVPILFALLI